MRLIFQGRVRLKAGAIKIAHYRFYVKWDVLIGLKKGLVVQVPLLGVTPCDVDQ